MNIPTILILLTVGYGHCDIFTDLDYLVSIFPGVYDNLKQYENDIAAGVTPSERHLHMTTRVVDEDVPIMAGRQTFYLEQYRDGDRSMMTRQKLYSFYVDGDLQIHLLIYSFVDPARFAHSEPHSALFRELTKQDLEYSVGCDVFWDRLSQDLFRSRMYNTCVYIMDGVQYILTDTNYLSPSYLTVNERWSFANNGSTYRYNPIPYNETKQQQLLFTKNYESNTKIADLETLKLWVQTSANIGYRARRACHFHQTGVETGVLTEFNQSDDRTHMKARVLP